MEIEHRAECFNRGCFSHLFITCGGGGALQCMHGGQRKICKRGSHSAFHWIWWLGAISLTLHTDVLGGITQMS